MSEPFEMNVAGCDDCPFRNRAYDSDECNHPDAPWDYDIPRGDLREVERSGVIRLEYPPRPDDCPLKTNPLTVRAQ